MSYPRAMFVGMATLVVLYLPGYIWIQETLDWSGWKTFWVCTGALVPWTILCVLLDSIVNLFRKESAYSAELIHAPVFVLYFGIPAILIYEWIGLKWFLVIAGSLAGVFLFVTLFIAFFGERLFNKE